jgi:hypothetical protein
VLLVSVVLGSSFVELVIISSVVCSVEIIVDSVVVCLVVFFIERFDVCNVVVVEAVVVLEADDLMDVTEGTQNKIVSSLAALFVE